MGVTRRAFFAPSEGTWLLWGQDPRELELEPVGTAAHADVLVAPRLLPEELSAAVLDAWSAMPLRRELVALDAPTSCGVPVADVLEHGAHHGHDVHGHHEHGHEEHAGDHEDHGGHHDHHDMMAVTGDPSEDGLVMEDLEVVLGPLSPVLPAGVVARLTLDGDVVCAADVEAVLHEPGGPIPDPTTPAAWRAALASARGDRSGWMADVELERAASHAAWFMALGDALGWPQLTGRARALAGTLARVRQGGAAPAAAGDDARRLRDLVEDSRRLRSRLRGLAVVSADDVARLQLAGPIARAGGIALDARAAAPAYADAGFRPAVRESGDAEARALVRAEEITTSLDLLDRLSDNGDPPVPDAPVAAVEGPRGPLTATAAGAGTRPAFRALGHDGALAAAGESVHRLEWSAAIAALVSFDLSGWRVG